MLKLLKIVSAVVVLAVLVVVGIAMTKPSSFEVKRSADIKAPPEKIVATLSDFHAWAQWSPWEKLDPNMKKFFSGPPSGVGSSYAWEGNSKAGAGRMEITEASPTKVTIKLDFLKPFEAHNFVDFLLEPKGESTHVTWSMHGPNPFMAKVMQVFMNMDKVLGKDFESGLASLKSVAEKS
jgi:carbon monoxide dehydrogenase subunit G